MRGFRLIHPSAHKIRETPVCPAMKHIGANMCMHIKFACVHACWGWGKHCMRADHHIMGMRLPHHAIKHAMTHMSCPVSKHEGPRHQQMPQTTRPDCMIKQPERRVCGIGWWTMRAQGALAHVRVTSTCTKMGDLTNRLELEFHF